MNKREWNEIIATFPDPHILQSWDWGQVKGYTGWEPDYKIWGSLLKPDGAALILRKPIPIPALDERFSLFYIPKGPLVRDWSNLNLIDKILKDIQHAARKHGAIFIKIDPDVPLGTGIPGSPDDQINQIGSLIPEFLKARGWRFSKDQIQFRNTTLINLIPTEDEILARMKQKTRYNVRLASRKGVVVRVGGKGDLDLLYKMYAQTSIRDGFVIRDQGYYQHLWGVFMEAKLEDSPEDFSPVCEPLIAEVEGDAVAAVVIFRFAGKAYYMHGMSTSAHRRKMPNYLLQWEAIRRAKKAGCDCYDLWGAPDNFEENDPMWGVFRFKQGLGGVVNRTIGAYDLPMKPIIYQIYTQIFPKFLDLMRRRGVRSTHQLVEIGSRNTD